jgi:hypothetical protein
MSMIIEVVDGTDWFDMRLKDGRMFKVRKRVMYTAGDRVRLEDFAPLIGVAWPNGRVDGVCVCDYFECLTINHFAPHTSMLGIPKRRVIETCEAGS